MNRSIGIRVRMRRSALIIEALNDNEFLTVADENNAMSVFTPQIHLDLANKYDGEVVLIGTLNTNEDGVFLNFTSINGEAADLSIGSF